MFYLTGVVYQKQRSVKASPAVYRISPVCFKQESSVQALVLTKHLQWWVEFMWVHRACKEADFCVSLNTLTILPFTQETRTSLLPLSTHHPAAWASMFKSHLPEKC